MIRLVYFIPTYVLFLLFRTIMILLGWITVPLATLLGRYTNGTSNRDGRSIIVFKDKLMWPWSNDEDGIVAGDELIGKPQWMRIIYWSAVRNPANNLRFVRFLSCMIDASKVKYIATRPQTLGGHYVESVSVTHYDKDDLRFRSLTWCGVYSNIRIQFKMFGKIWRFWLGWKIYPEDINGVNPASHRAKGAGFATQFKRIYPRN